MEQESWIRKSKNILIIGEHSYIGTCFREYIEKEAPQVTVEAVSARNGKWQESDFSEYDTVLHVAAIVHKKEQPEMLSMYQEVNTQLPVDLAKKAKSSGVKQFVFLSTMAVYGSQPSPISGNTRLQPTTMYGKSKLEAEQKLKDLADEKFTVIILRPPMVYGPNCPGNYARLSGLACKLPFFPNVKNQRSMVYIENLCACIHEEIEKRAESYRIICPQNIEYVNTTELVKAIRKSHGKGTLILPFPQLVMGCLATRISTIEKLFGDYYYAHESGEESYQIVDFAESVRRSEVGNRGR